MKENPWLVVAFVEFVILLVVLVPKVLTMILNRIKDGKTGDGGQVGTVRNLRYVRRGFAGCGGDATIFEVHKGDGSVSLLGIEGHDHDIHDGCSLEFWPSPEVIVFEDRNRIRENKDGTKSSWKERVEWYRFERYRVLPEVMSTEPAMSAT